jgi:hypothetical protein
MRVPTGSTAYTAEEVLPADFFGGSGLSWRW